MQLFYSTSIQENLIFLNEEESRHCIKVLRLKIGNLVNVTDGKGNHYKTTILEDNPRKTMLQIDKIVTIDKHPIHIHIAISPTKNISRFEWFLEKSVEMGISEITPVIASQSERKKINFDRCHKIILSGMKQSLQYWLPQFNQLIVFSEFLKREDQNDKFIGYCDEVNPEHLFDVYEKGDNATILIGPEGDFSKEEFDLAKKKGYKPISLGKSRLRTETAGLAACHIINLKNR
jgi:16S rRNA (uracil1498-N3)-methyltransferase